jgi:hypothetical protein
MPAKREFSPYQQKVIRAYYQNREGIQQQALADLVSDLYLATTEAKKASLWKRAESLLASLGTSPATVAAVVSKRNLAALAELVTKALG